jgi:RNA polymerase sigma factor (TIGR02999 family)
MRGDEPITERMQQAGSCDVARSALLDSVYGELVKIARLELSRHRRGATLNTRALVNEAYLKLFAQAPDYASRQHFFATAARAMRQVIVDYARQRCAERRGGGVEALSLDDLHPEDIAVDVQADRLVALDSALTRLAALDPRLAQVVELRFFAGMEVEPLAELLGVSVPTIVRDTRTAKAFLQREMG